MSGLPTIAGGEPAHVQIERWLVAAIGRGELAVGAKLLPEQELAAAIGVSRMTLRQALGRLEARGVIARRPGRSGGTFVAQPRIDVDLSGWAGFTAVMRRVDVRVAARVLRAETVPAPRDVAAALALPRGARVHVVVRVRTAARQPLALERSWFPAGLFPDLLSRRLTGSLYAVLRKAYDADPRVAEEFVDAAVAGPDEAAALDVPVGAALLLVERTALTAAGQPVEYARDLFRPDRMRLRVRSDLTDRDGEVQRAASARTRAPAGS